MSAFLLQSLLSDAERLGLGPWRSGPPMDWKETPEAHIFKFDLPSLGKEDVKLQLHDDRVLHVSAVVVGRGEEEDNKENCKWHCRERVDGGSFRREFRLPENAMVEEIKASMRDGVLLVRVAKDPSKKKKKKKKRKHGSRHAVEINAGGQGEDSFAAKGLAPFFCCKA